MKTRAIKNILLATIACIVGAILLANRDHKSVHHQNPPALWSRQFGTTADDWIGGIAVDHQRNLFVVGSTAGSLFAKIQSPTISSEGISIPSGEDIFLCKYDVNGKTIWAKQFGTGEGDYPGVIALDSAGNFYIGGGTLGNLFTNNVGGQDAFLVKYDSNGNQIWGKQFGSIGEDTIDAVTIDGQNNVIAVGSTEGSLFSANTGPDNNGHPVSDSFVVKFTSNGNQLWGHQFGSDNSDEADGVAIDSQGDVFVVGSTLAGNVKQLFAPVKGGADAYITKYSAAGIFLWGKQFGTDGTDGANCICVDKSGNAYVGGNENTTTDNGRTGSGFVTKFDGNGNQIWSNLIGATGEDVRSLTLAPQGKIVAVGDTQASLFGQNSGDMDIFIVKYDLNGNQLWNLQEGSTRTDFVHSLAVDIQGYIYVAGDTQGSLFSSNLGGDDAFIQKLSPSGQMVSAILHRPSP